MKRTLMFAYGLSSYLVFFVVFAWTIAFLGNFAIPRTISSPPEMPTLLAAMINLALIVQFAIQHSVMARPFFKRWITKVIPQACERSTYVLLSSLSLMLIVAFWQPIGGHIWVVKNAWIVGLIYALSFVGWGLLFYATCLLGHLELFGVAQVWRAFRSQPTEPSKFRTPSLYKFVRHPIYLGWLIAIWATPTMSIAHWFFALSITVYILVAVQLEERDLVDHHGETYRQYRRMVPMLFPKMKKAKTESLAESTT